MKARPIVFVLLFIVFVAFLINGCNNKEQISEQNNVQTIKEEDIGSVSIKIIDKDTGKPIKGSSLFRYDCMDGPCVGGSWHGRIDDESNIKIEQLKFGTYDFTFRAEDYCRDLPEVTIDSEEEKKLTISVRNINFQETTQDKQKGMEAFSNLMKSLNKQVVSYNGSYQEGFYRSSWAGRSGAGWGSGKSNIYINVYNNKILDYKKQYFGETSSDPYEKYLGYYNKAKNKICKKEYTRKSECIPIRIIWPELKEPLMGCKLSRDSTVSIHYCVCGEKEILIHDYENKSFGISCEEDVWQENMRFGWSYIYYHPEKKEGICFLELIDKEGKYWATLCKNENFTLIPLVDNPNILKNTVCYQRSINTCECNFDLIEIITCEDKIPQNLDSEIKKEIISYLNEINIASISEEDNKDYGHCYYFFHKCLEQKFCFNQEGLITYAQWGIDADRQMSTHINTHYFEKIEEPSLYSPNPMNEDPNYCKNGPSQDNIFSNYGLLKTWKNECWINLVKKTQNISYCGNINRNKYQCYDLIKNFSEDSSICNNVKEDDRSGCYHFFNYTPKGIFY